MYSLYFFLSRYIRSDQQITITRNTSNQGIIRLVAVAEDATAHGLVAVTVLGGLLDLFDGLGNWCRRNVCLDWGRNGCRWNVLVPWCWWCRWCGGNVCLDGSWCWWCRLRVVIAGLRQLRNIGQGAGHKGNGEDKEFLLKQRLGNSNSSQI